jgi:hypothetical protein
LCVANDWSLRDQGQCAYACVFRSACAPSSVPFSLFPRAGRTDGKMLVSGGRRKGAWHFVRSQTLAILRRNLILRRIRAANSHDECSSGDALQHFRAAIGVSTSRANVNVFRCCDSALLPHTRWKEAGISPGTIFLPWPCFLTLIVWRFLCGRQTVPFFVLQIMHIKRIYQEDGGRQERSCPCAAQETGCR